MATDTATTPVEAATQAATQAVNVAPKTPKTPELSSAVISGLEIGDDFKRMFQENYDALLESIESLQTYYSGFEGAAEQAEAKFFESGTDTAAALLKRKAEIEEAAARLQKAQAEYNASIKEAIAPFLPTNTGNKEVLSQRYNGIRDKIKALQTLSETNNAFSIPRAPVGPRMLSDSSAGAPKAKGDGAVVRQWLSEHGYNPPARGKISDELRAIYQRESGK